MADGEGLAPFDLPPEWSPGSPAAGPAGVLGELGETEGAAVAEVAAGPTPALDPWAVAGVDRPAAEVPAEVPAEVSAEADVAADTAAEPGGKDPADLLVAVHPAVTRTGTSTSAAAIRRMPTSSPILCRQGPV